MTYGVIVFNSDCGSALAAAEADKWQKCHQALAETRAVQLLMEELVLEVGLYWKWACIQNGLHSEISCLTGAFSWLALQVHA